MNHFLSVDYKKKMEDLACCVLIPTYNNDTALEAVIKDVSQYTDNILLVNDGSTDSTAQILAQYTPYEIISYPKNQGKGHALQVGFKKAADLGYRYAITIDSDGQHLGKDIPTFLEKIEAEPDSIIIGARNMQQENVPSKNNFAHNFSNFWFKVETGVSVPDTQSGYRLYPVNLVAPMRFFTKKYEFELEILVRASWKGIPVTSVPIDVFYPTREERITHFRPFQDFSRISVLNTVFVFITFLYIKPRDFFRSLKKKSWRESFQRYIVSSEEPSWRLSLAVALGAFFAVAPFWGWQMILTVFFATLFRLNKAVSLLASNLSFGPLAAVAIFASYKLGTLLLGVDPVQLGELSQFKLETVKNLGGSYIVGAFSLGIVLAILFSAISYTILVIFRGRRLKKMGLNKKDQ